MTGDGRGPSRRSVLLAGIGGTLAGAAGSGALVHALHGAFDGAASAPDPNAAARAPAVPVDPHGTWQAGIERPAAPQPHAQFLIFRGITSIGGWMPQLSSLITALCTRGEGLLDGPGDLTVTVGLGPDLVDATASGGVGAEHLPAFAGDDVLDSAHRTGDVCVQLCASDPVALGFAAERIREVVPGELSFRQPAFRPPGTGTVVRSPLGFHDGIAIPRGRAELEESVFLSSGPFAGASIWVIRQFALDIDRFRALDASARAAAVGRREADGAPLSGGAQDDDVQLGAKSADGQYLVPAEAHVRRAHPSFTGSGLMLRRSYGYDNGDADRGLVFVSFQNDLQTFVATQRRLDEADAMLAFATPRASFSFLALPGFGADRPLGAALTI